LMCGQGYKNMKAFTYMRHADGYYLAACIVTRGRNKSPDAYNVCMSVCV